MGKVGGVRDGLKDLARKSNKKIGLGSGRISKIKDSEKKYVAQKDDYLQAFTESLGDLHHCAISEELYYNCIHDEEFKGVDRDESLNRIRFQLGILQESSPISYQSSSKAIRGALAAHRYELEPELFFEKHLPVWDNKTDHLKEHCDKVVLDPKRGITNGDLYEFVLEWMINVYRRISSTERPLNRCPILVSEAGGVGKDTFIESLCSGFDTSFESANLNQKRELTIQISHAAVINISEFDQIREFPRGENLSISELKDFITRQKVKVRPAYASKAENFKVKASFIGSSNTTKFIGSDSSGLRRYLIFFMLYSPQLVALGKDPKTNDKRLEISRKILSQIKVLAAKSTKDYTPGQGATERMSVLLEELTPPSLKEYIQSEYMEAVDTFVFQRKEIPISHLGVIKAEYINPIISEIGQKIGKSSKSKVIHNILKELGIKSEDKVTAHCTGLLGRPNGKKESIRCYKIDPKNSWEEIREGKLKIENLPSETRKSSEKWAEVSFLPSAKS